MKSVRAFRILALAALLLAGCWNPFKPRVVPFSTGGLGSEEKLLIELAYAYNTKDIVRYMDLLAGSFNPVAAAGVMCRTYLSVGWDGTLYDCDFNQMLDLGVSLDHGAPLVELAHQHQDRLQDVDRLKAGDDHRLVIFLRGMLIRA